jgi:hypothetical protein
MGHTLAHLSGDTDISRPCTHALSKALHIGSDAYMACKYVPDTRAAPLIGIQSDHSKNRSISGWLAGL